MSNLPYCPSLHGAKPHFPSAKVSSQWAEETSRPQRPAHGGQDENLLQTLTWSYSVFSSRGRCTIWFGSLNKEGGKFFLFFFATFGSLRRDSCCSYTLGCNDLCASAFCVFSSWTDGSQKLLEAVLESNQVHFFSSDALTLTFLDYSHHLLLSTSTALQ